MKTYLLSATGVIFLSLIVSIIIPEGKLHKTINFVMRLICIFVLIQPLTSIFKVDISSESKDSVDYAFIEEVYSEHQSGQLEKVIKDEFGIDSECSVFVSFADGDFKAVGVSVKLKEEDKNFISGIYEYLDGKDYINISVYAEST